MRPCTLALLLALGLTALPVPAAASGSAMAEETEEAVLPDMTAPGYALSPGDQAYQGFGTDPSAPVFLLDGSASASSEKKERETPEELKDLLDLGSKDQGVSGKQAAAENLRGRALRSAAHTLGFQRGAAWRAAQLNRACQNRVWHLDRVFNFQSLLLAGRVLPPVLRWAGPASALPSASSAVEVEETYRIIAPARVVTVAPTWRDYLLTAYPAFEARSELLPRNEEEKALWRESVLQGWDEGVPQAESVFRLNMQRLVADFRGMLRFSLLEKRGLISLPSLAEGRLAVKVGKKTLDINQTCFRITVPASFRDPDAAKAERSQDAEVLP